MLTPTMRTAGREGHFLSDERIPSGSIQVAPVKKLAERQRLPSSGVSVHFDHEGDAHYTCATQELVWRKVK